MTALRVLIWSIWQRNCRAMLLVAGFLVFFCTVILRVTSEGKYPIVLAISYVFVIFCYLALTGIFMYQDTDVGVRGSAYPVHMFTLPVRTYKLVLVPMLLGTIVYLSTGIAISKVVNGYYPDFPVFWPAFLVSGVLAMLQALFWYPLGVAYSKLVLTLISLPALVYFVSVPLSDKVSEQVVCQYLGLLIIVSYAIAYQGVVRARRGDAQLFTLSPKVALGRTIKDIKWLNFRDASAAQRWYEWRQQGLVLPSLVLFCCVIFSAGIYLQPGYKTPVTMFGPNKNGLVPMVLPFIHTYTLLLVFLIPMLSLIVGCGARRTDIKHSDRTFLLFFGTRPMSDAGLVVQKFWLAMKSSLVAWGILLVQFLVLLPLTAGKWDMNDQATILGNSTIFEFLLTYLNPGFVLQAICFFLILILLTWRNYAIGFWTELSGKTWLRYGHPIGLVALIVGYYVWMVIRYRYGVAITIQPILIFVWSINVIRAILAIALIRRQLLSGVLKPKALQNGAFLGSLMLGVLMFAVFVCTVNFRAVLYDQQVQSSLNASILVVGLTLLWTPIVRILLATEMLHRNRHRAN